MIAELALLPDRRAVRRMDLAAALWTAVFLALGVIAGVELWRLSRVQDTLHQVNSAVGQRATRWACSPACRSWVRAQVGWPAPSITRRLR